jgi:anaerobic magnesium-protoporphyrin IX monomethyl ester cyclase
MKILLVNVPIKFNQYEWAEPLGISYLVAILHQAGYKVMVKDYGVEFFSAQAFKELIINFDIEVIGISSRTASFSSAKYLVGLLAEIGYSGYILMGGQHVSSLPEYSLKEIDYPKTIIIDGEGEQTILDVCDYISSGYDLKTFSSIKGIYYLSDGEIIKTPRRPLIKDLDQLPLPARHLLPMNLYKTAYCIITSRGCPFHCIYCDKSVSKKQVRLRTPQNIILEIEDVLSKYGPRPIFFVDDFFTLHKERVYEFVELLQQKHINIDWWCLSRVDGVDEELVGKLKSAGCKRITFGIESGDEETLRKIKKKTNVKAAEKAVRLAVNSGISVKANFILGFGWDDYSTWRKTIKLAARLPVNYEYAFYYATPFPGSELWDIALKENVVSLHNINWDIFTEEKIFFKSSHINPADFDKLEIVVWCYLLREKIRQVLFSAKAFKYLYRYIKFIFSIKRIRTVFSPIEISIYDKTKSIYKKSNMSKWDTLKLLFNPFSYFKKNEK